MNLGEDYKELINLLEERGHSEEEIAKIMTRVEEYEKQTQRDSIMDSIGAGHLSIDQLVSEALGEG